MFPEQKSLAPLDAARKQKLDTWLKEKKCHCPCCDSEQWEERGIGGLKLVAGYVATHEYSYPVILLMCGKCGHLEFLCPYKIGILP